MKPITHLLFWCICSCCLYNRGLAQSRATSDTLWMLTTYIKDVQAAIPKNKEDTTSKMKLLHQVISKGTANKHILQRQLAMFSADSLATQAVIRQYNLLLQSVVLLHSDLKQVSFQDAAVQENVNYLRQHLPPFIHSLYFYSRRAGRLAE